MFMVLETTVLIAIKAVVGAALEVLQVPPEGLEENHIQPNSLHIIVLEN